MSIEAIVKEARRKALVDGVAAHMAKSAKIPVLQDVGQLLMMLAGKATRGAGKGIRRLGIEGAGEAVERAGSKVKRKAGLSKLLGAQPKSEAFTRMGPKSFKGGLERMNPAHYETMARLEKLQPEAESASRLADFVGGAGLAGGGTGIAALLSKILGGGGEKGAAIKEKLTKSSAAKSYVGRLLRSSVKKERKGGRRAVRRMLNSALSPDEVKKIVNEGVSVNELRKRSMCGKKHGKKKMKYQKKKAALFAVKVAAAGLQKDAIVSRLGSHMMRYGGKGMVMLSNLLKKLGLTHGAHRLGSLGGRVSAGGVRSGRLLDLMQTPNLKTLSGMPASRIQTPAAMKSLGHAQLAGLGGLGLGGAGLMSAIGGEEERLPVPPPVVIPGRMA